jgi:hypothetical protein
MSKTRVWITITCFSFALASFSVAQSGRKPGLYDVTSQISMGGANAPQMPQMPQLPPGVTLPPGMQMPQMASPFAPHTTQICVSQAMVDKYGGPYSSPPNGNCKTTNIVMKPDGMTATIACTGQLTANGTVQATFVDENTTKTTVHMTGTMQMGPNGNQPVDMTMQVTSVYKGSDCGSVKPVTMPPSN